eukprot:GILI01012949.1.p1 GENE.GILI01012949.1~~GILI01012949.1.p1  ORF type:complete len:468 (-),score=80.29 GILI01012949.1:1178-2581(-)
MSELVSCAKCQTRLEDALILTCDHNLCLQCAAQNLQREELRGIHTFKTVVCDVCGASTVLDPSCAAQLLNQLPRAICGQCEKQHATLECIQCKEFFCAVCGPMLHKKGRMQQHQLQPAIVQPVNNNTHSMSSQSGPLMSKSRSASPVRSEARPIREIISVRTGVACKDHPDEEVTYFCLDCESSCICTECIVHGVHRSHEVQSLKRAFPLVKAKVEDMLFHLSSRMEDLSLMEQRVESHRREIIENTQTIKQQMAKAFEEVRQRLDKKERELMGNSDLFKDEVCAELDVYVRAAREKTYEMDAAADTIRKIIDSKDEVGLLNFFAESRERVHSILTAEPPQLSELPAVASRKCFLNMDATNAHIEALHGLHLSIAALRGMEDPSAAATVRNQPLANTHPLPNSLPPSYAAPPSFAMSRNLAAQPSVQTFSQPPLSMSQSTTTSTSPHLRSRSTFYSPMYTGREANRW